MNVDGLRSVRRFVGGFLLVAISSAGGLLILLNVLLQSNALELLIEKAQKDVTLRLDVGLVWWPGHVEGTNLQLLIHDPAIQAELSVDGFVVDWNPLSLFEKTFEAGFVDVTGVRFKLRMTRPLELLCRQPPGLPLIPGESLPPGAIENCERQKDTARSPGPKPTRDQVFRVRLGQVEATDVSEIWIERYRGRGRAKVRGAWAFFPTFETSIDLSSLATGTWDVTRAGRRIVGGLGARARGSVDAIDLRRLDDWVKEVSVEGKASADWIGLEPVFGPRGVPARGHLKVWLDWSMERGVQKYLGVRLVGRELSVDLGKTTLHGSPELTLRMSTAETATVASFESGTMTLARVRLGSDSDGPTETTEIEAQVSSDSWLSASPARASIGLSAHTSDLQPLRAVISGLPEAMIEVLIDPSTSIRANGRFEASRAKVEFADLKGGAGALSATGHLQLAPALDGRIEASLGPISVTKRLGAPSREGGEPK